MRKLIITIEVFKLLTRRCRFRAANIGHPQTDFELTVGEFKFKVHSDRLVKHPGYFKVLMTGGFAVREFLVHSEGH
jgi:hypothetical protein